VSLGVVAAVFLFAIPRIATYPEVWGTIRELAARDAWLLGAATVANLVTTWLQNMATLPGLRFLQAAVVTQTGATVANVVPGGGAVAVAVTVAMLRSWGHTAASIALLVTVTGVWNMFVRLGLPAVALGLLALQSEPDPRLRTAAAAGVATLAAALLLFGLVLWREELARRVGGGLERAARRLSRRIHLERFGDRAVRFRRHTIRLIARRWPAITVTTLLSHLALWLVMLLALRGLGVDGSRVTIVECLAVFAFGRLISALPVTPGGLGVVELGYIGGLVAAGGPEASVVGAVLLFRALTYGVQVPLGGLTFLVWRRAASWRRPLMVEEELLTSEGVGP
jgi:uncharacterized protein (TIRG00374 family)